MRLNMSFFNWTSMTSEGARAAVMTPEQALRRSVLSCLLWENEFYEDGQSIATRIFELVADVRSETVAALAIEARNQHNLRHVPLLLVSALAFHRGGKIVEDTLVQVIQRADELAEFLAIHAHANGFSHRNVKPTISAAIKRGLARAFTKFDAYQLAKYDRKGPIRLRDVLFLSHAKPRDEAQAEIWRQLIAGNLPSPDTWEVALSAQADKRATFERLIREKKLGYLALLRNLRTMAEAGCNQKLMRQAILARRGADKILPFRYVAAARAVPQLEGEIDTALCESIASGPCFKGRTIVLVDVSGSMEAKLSARGDLKRIDAAAALASVIYGKLRVFTFSDRVVEVPPRRGMAGIDAIIASQPHYGTNLFEAVAQINAAHQYERLIVISDEQAAAPQNGAYKLPDPTGRGYMINVASAKAGVGYGKWTHIDGFSENVLRYILELEGLDRS